MLAGQKGENGEKGREGICQDVQVRCFQVMVMVVRVMLVLMGMVVGVAMRVALFAMQPPGAEQVDKQTEDRHPDCLVELYLDRDEKAADRFPSHDEGNDA
jgi:hypothetical protein